MASPTFCYSIWRGLIRRVMLLWRILYVLFFGLSGFFFSFLVPRAPSSILIPFFNSSSLSLRTPSLPSPSRKATASRYPFFVHAIHLLVPYHTLHRLLLHVSLSSSNDDKQNANLRTHLLDSSTLSTPSRSNHTPAFAPTYSTGPSPKLSSPISLVA
jgi:hypothetical protein